METRPFSKLEIAYDVFITVVFLSAWYYLYKEGAADAPIMEGLFGILFGYYFVHGFIWKRTIYVLAYEAKPTKEHEVQRYVFFIIGALLMVLGAKVMVENGI